MFLSNGKATGVATTWSNCGICVLFLCASNLLTLVQETKTFLTLDKKIRNRGNNKRIQTIK